MVKNYRDIDGSRVAGCAMLVFYYCVWSDLVIDYKVIILVCDDKLSPHNFSAIYLQKELYQSDQRSYPNRNTSSL